MSNIVDFPNQENCLEEASLWIARLDRELTPEEETALSHWLAQNKNNLQTLIQLAKLWDKMDRLSLLSEIFYNQPKKKSSFKHYAIAASFFAVCLSIVISLQLMPSLTKNKLPESIYQTSIGEQRKIFLEDGSTLILNTNSQVEVIYSANQRLVLLNRGEMHIDVAHDETRPLRVVAQNKIVQAVGTAFDVRLLDSKRVKLWVTEGKVLVANKPNVKNLKALEQIKVKPDSLFVSKGEKAILTDVKKEIEKITEGDMTAQLSWQEGNIVFRGETLNDAVREFSRYSDKTFIIRDVSLQSVRIAGVFKIGDTSSLLSTLENNFDIQYEYASENKIYLSQKIQ